MKKKAIAQGIEKIVIGTEISPENVVKLWNAIVRRTENGIIVSTVIEKEKKKTGNVGEGEFIIVNP